MIALGTRGTVAIVVGVVVVVAVIVAIAITMMRRTR
jgi:hypothetical protein